MARTIKNVLRLRMRQIRSDSTGLVACSFFFGKFCFDD